MAFSLGKMPTTYVRRLFAVEALDGIGRVQLGSMLRRVRRARGVGISMPARAAWGEAGRRPRATCVFAASSPSWAKAMAMKAEMTRRPLLRHAPARYA